MKTIEFQPQDSLFFRDGRPFNQGETQFAPSLFPPSPQTLIGALRAHWAKTLGWSGKGRWENKVTATLGDGENLNGMRFKGPLLLKKGEPLFLVPALLMGKVLKTEDKKLAVSHLTRLKPSTLTYRCDIGDNVCLPEPEDKDNIDGYKLLEDWWVTHKGLEQILQGNLPEFETLIHQTDLWRSESRVGITLNPDTATTELNALYATSHIRLSDQHNQPITLAMMAENTTCQTINASVSLGGEGRSAWIKTGDPIAPPAMPKFTTQNHVIRYTVTVLTPLLPTHGTPKQNSSFENLPGHLISACLPRPQRWGGWNSVTREPQTLQPHLAPGSVLFMEADSDVDAELKACHWNSIGRRTDWGYGLVVIGIWQ